MPPSLSTLRYAFVVWTLLLLSISILVGAMFMSHVQRKHAAEITALVTQIQTLQQSLEVCIQTKIQQDESR